MTEKEQKAIELLKEEISRPVEVPEDKFNTFILYNIENTKIILNLISKLQADIEIKDKVIDYMAKEINKAYYDENHFYLFFEGNFDDKNLPKRINKIKQYFYGKVENNE